MTDRTTPGGVHGQGLTRWRTEMRKRGRGMTPLRRLTRTSKEWEERREQEGNGENWKAKGLSGVPG